MKKVYAPLFALSLFMATAHAEYGLETAPPPLSSMQISVAEQNPTPLSLRIAVVEALRYRHWVIESLERDRIVATYDERIIELQLTENTGITINELPNKENKRLKRDWLPNLEKIIRDQIIYNQNIDRMRSFYATKP